MPARLRRSITLAVVLATALSLPVAAGGSFRAWPSVQELGPALPGGHVFSSVWDWLRAFWSSDEYNNRSGTDHGASRGRSPFRPLNGCGADPNGHCG